MIKLKFAPIFIFLVAKLNLINSLGLKLKFFVRKFHICFCFVTAMSSQATSPRMTSLIQCYHLWSSKEVSFFWGQSNNCTVSRRYLFGLNSEWERSKEVVLSWHRRNDWTALRRSFALVGPVKGKHQRGIFFSDSCHRRLMLLTSCCGNRTDWLTSISKVVFISRRHWTWVLWGFSGPLLLRSPLPVCFSCNFKARRPAGVQLLFLYRARICASGISERLPFFLASSEQVTCFSEEKLSALLKKGGQNLPSPIV